MYSFINIFFTVTFLVILAGCSLTGRVSLPVYDQSLAVDSFFCQVSDCSLILRQFINNGSDISCALYDIDDPGLFSSLESKNARVVTDSKRFDDEFPISKSNLHFGNANHLMHNKFCVIDNIVVMGSFNPTGQRHADNMLVVHSSNVADSYSDEFEELWKTPNGKGNPTKNTAIIGENLSLATYFCPEDACEDHVIAELQKAERSIRFMVFSFTNDRVANVLIEKKGNGIQIKGLFEPSQRNKYDNFDQLIKAGIDVQPFNSKNLLHHKLFIIDNATVITGSANPTKNGYFENDENIVIIQDEKTANLFIQEFERLWQKKSEDSKKKSPKIIKGISLV